MMMGLAEIRTGLCSVAAVLVVCSGAWAQSDGGYLAPAPAPNAPEGYLPAENPNPAPAPSGYLQAGERGGYLQEGNSRGGYFEDKAATADVFVPAPADARENINGGTLMLIAYTLFWLFTLVYVGALAVRGRAAQREVADLQNRIRELDERLEDLENGRA